MVLVKDSNEAVLQADVVVFPIKKREGLHCFGNTGSL